VPLLFVLSILFLGVTGLFWKLFWYLLETEMILYVMVLLVGALVVGLKSGWRFVPIAPLVFLILHFAYGLGCLWGFIRFSILKGWGMKRPEEIRVSR
jgi:hypothetical protein